MRFLASICAILVVVVASVAIAGSAAPVAGDPATTVVVDPTARTVGQGEQFTLDVLVTPDTDIAGAQCDISFDSSLLTADSVAEGNLLTQGGASTYFNAGTINNTAGTITGIAGAITTPGATASAEGVFATVTFTAGVTNGASDIDLSSVIVGDAGGHEVAVAVTNGSVTVAAVGTPTVATDAATLVEETSATLNGTLTDDGGEACEYQFQYGTGSGVYDYNTGWTGSKTSGQSFSESISGLSKGTRYYFIAQARNSAGTVSGTEESFLTRPDAPANFVAGAINTTRIDLSWIKAAGAEKTMIRRSAAGYPVAYDEGDEVYFDTGTSAQDLGLSANVTYYYSAWSYVVGSEQWSDSYAQAVASTTALVGDVNGDGHVNVQDLVLVGQHWGETGTPGWIPEDVHVDGVINVQDMVVVGQHWTG